MAHFAILGTDNIVQKVITISNDNAINEQTGVNFLKKIFNDNSLIIFQTSYNTYGNKHLLGGTPFRGNYAGIGHIYDATNDVFYAPQPYPSWILNKNTWLWEAPIPYPTDGKLYYWDETTKTWIVSS